MLCFRKLSAKKSLSITGKYQVFLKKVSCHTVPKKLVGESFCAVFQKIIGNDKFIGQREVSKFFKDGLLSHSNEKLRRGILLCCVSENCRQRKVYRSKGSIKIFQRRFCCLKVLKNFVGEPFSAVFQKFVGNKKLWIRGSTNIFQRMFVVSQY